MKPYSLLYNHEKFIDEIGPLIKPVDDILSMLNIDHICQEYKFGLLGVKYPDSSILPRTQESVVKETKNKLFNFKNGHNRNYRIALIYNEVFIERIFAYVTEYYG